MEKYQEILRPIADLAQNFNLNLSDFLQRYASRLRRNSINVSCVNFAHAGLVIQNSSDIYGRKVDFLYQSVMQLIDLMNSRQSTSTDAETGAKEPVKTRAPRRRRPTTIVAMEDFIPIDCIPSDKQLTINTTPGRHHLKSKKKWKLPTLGTYTCEKARKTQDNPIFDEHHECMGQLSDFRLSWYFGPDFSLEESLQERRGDNITIFEARVTNMPTPEYSDEGGITDQVLMTNLQSEEDEENAVPEQNVVPGENVVLAVNVVPDMNVVTEAHNALDNVQAHSPDIEIRLASSATSVKQKQIVPEKVAKQKKKDNAELKAVERRTMITMNDYLKFADRPEHPTKVFALPPELRLKSKERPLFPMSKFLMSDMLKHQLQIRGVVPVIMTKKEEQQHIKELIQTHIKNLGRKPPFNIQALKEEQGEFLGFEEHETCLDSTQDDDSDPDILHGNFEAMPTPPLSRSVSPASPVQREGIGVYQDVVASEMAAYHAKKNAQQTISSVMEWHKSLKDKLENASQNSVFDVHTYGSQILNKFSKLGTEMAFKDVVNGHRSSEVCRYFVSSLMLANTGNLELSDNGPDTLRMKLLSRKRHHEMEEFLVPSALPQSQSEEKDVATSNKKRKAHESNHARQPSPPPEKLQATKRPSPPREKLHAAKRPSPPRENLHPARQPSPPREKFHPAKRRGPPPGKLHPARQPSPPPGKSVSCLRVPVIHFANSSNLPPSVPGGSSARLKSFQIEESSTRDTHIHTVSRTPSPLPGPLSPGISRTPSPHPGPSGLLAPCSSGSSESQSSQYSIEERQYERQLEETPKRSSKQIKGTGPWKVKSKK